MTQKQLHLNAFLMEAGHHEASWRLPGTDPGAALDVRHYVRLAQLAEAAKFDSIFLADGSVTMGTGEFRASGQFEPLTILTAISTATERIGLIATASTTYNEPYALARRLASVDHVSKGRAGWNIVTSATQEEAANFSLAERPLQATRYERADEFLEVAKKLWDSWGDDHFLGDKERGRWGDPTQLRAIDHVGTHFRVAGPLNVPRPVQGYPLLVQAGASEQGKAFAARHAEAIFVAHQTLEQGQAFYADIKARVAAEGRNPDHVLVLPGLVPIIGSTEAEATAKAQQLEDLRIPEYGLRQLAQILDIDEATDRPRRAAATRDRRAGDARGLRLPRPPGHRPGPAGEPDRPPAAQPPRRRSRPQRRHRHARTDRRPDGDLVHPGRRRRLQRDGRVAALGAGDVHRDGRADPARARPLPQRVRRRDAARALRAAAAGQPVRGRGGRCLRSPPFRHY